MPSVTIIGAGPAGVSASLYCVRAGLDVKIITHGESSLVLAEKIDNYYGFPEGISGKELYLNGIRQAEKLGAQVICDEVFSVSFDGSFVLETKSGKYSSDGVIIAAGSKRKRPDIKGLSEFEGRGVSYCAVCDAFFYKGKSAAVLGGGEYALHELRHLLPVVENAVVLTDGKSPEVEFPEGVEIVTKKISEIQGRERLEKIILDDGSVITANGLFIAYGTADGTDIAKKIGAVTENGKIRVNENMRTSVKRVYAAGDCTGGLLQVSKAVCDGATAALALIKELRGQA